MARGRATWVADPAIAVTQGRAARTWRRGRTRGCRGRSSRARARARPGRRPAGRAAAHTRGGADVAPERRNLRELVDAVLSAPAALPETAPGADTAPRAHLRTILAAAAARPRSSRRRPRRASLPGAPNCPVLPADNVWNKRVDALPVARGLRPADRRASAWATRCIRTSRDQGRYGIPFNVVTKKTPRSRVRFEYADESDRVRYPIPARPRIEGGGDRHVLMVDRDACRLYELFAVQRSGSGGWSAGSGAVLRPALQPPAAGRLDQRRRGRAADPPRPRPATTRSSAGASTTRSASRRRGPGAPTSTRPATSPRAASDPGLPPMGLRVRLKASVPLAGYRAPGARRADRAQALRDDPRRQRVALVRERRAGRRLGRRRPARASGASAGATSRSSTRRAFATDAEPRTGCTFTA